MKSQFLTEPDTWGDRIRTIRDDLEAGDLPRLYFIVALSLNDAYDSNDYDRHEILREMMEGVKMNDYDAVNNGIRLLEELPE